MVTKQIKEGKSLYCVDISLRYLIFKAQTNLQMGFQAIIICLKLKEMEYVKPLHHSLHL